MRLKIPSGMAALLSSPAPAAEGPKRPNMGRATLREPAGSFAMVSFDKPSYTKVLPPELADGKWFVGYDTSIWSVPHDERAAFDGKSAAYVEIIDPETLGAEKRIDLPSDLIEAAKPSPDGKSLVTLPVMTMGGQDPMFVLSTATGKETHRVTLRDEEGDLVHGMKDLEFSPDGQTAVVLAGIGKGRAYVLSAADLLTPPTTLGLPIFGDRNHDVNVRTIPGAVFAKPLQNGNILTVDEEGVARQLDADLKTVSELETGLYGLRNPTILASATSDGQLAVTAEFPGVPAYVYDSAGRLAHTLNLPGSTGELDGFKLSGDGRTLAITQHTGADDAKGHFQLRTTVTVIDVATSKVVALKSVDDGRPSSFVAERGG
jgi:hypothetical protein